MNGRFLPTCRTHTHTHTHIMLIIILSYYYTHQTRAGINYIYPSLYCVIIMIHLVVYETPGCRSTHREDFPETR